MGLNIQIEIEEERDALRERVEELEAALRPFARLASSITVSDAMADGRMLSLSNGTKMVGVSPDDFVRAAMVAEPGKDFTRSRSWGRR